jgi:F-type H+-transporting ATPase subunit a
MDKYTNPETYKTFNPSGEVIVALGIIFVLLILAIIVGILAKRADPLKRPKGLLKIVEWAVEKLDAFAQDTMGPGFENFGGILLGIIPFMFISFTIGITGLPTPMNSLAVPLSLALVTFILIHFTSMRFTKFRYFKRYVEPFAVFLPINLLSMWAPLLSMTLRMFGNAIVGWVLLGLLNGALESLSASVFSFINSGANQLFFVPIATPLLHAYFDLFSGFVQTMVFVFLTVLFISQERPDDIETGTVQVSRKEA